MATYNGEKYLRQQLESILPQLSEEDELVISDDHSTDSTDLIVKNLCDSRIIYLKNTLQAGVAHNFENALRHAHGDIVFLSDQDDVWLPAKIKEMTDFLLDKKLDIVTCDCSLTDENLNVTQPSYYANAHPLTKSAWGNLVKNLWLGSCMAFRREVIESASPFPANIVAHDLWLALYGQLHYRCGYYPRVLQLYRRHPDTVSFAGSKSKNSFYFRVRYRLWVLWYLLTYKWL